MGGTKTASYLILAVAIGYSFVMPTYGDIKLLNEQNKKYEESMDSISLIDNKIAELTTRINNLDPEVKEKIDIMLPSSFDFVKLVSDIDVVARQNGITINNIRAQEKNMNPNTAEGGALVAENYNSATIGFSFVSNYNNFLNFINELETSLRIMDVRSVQIKSATGSIYEFSVLYETYWLPS